MQFSFGKNWAAFIQNLYSQRRLDQATKSLRDFLDLEDLSGLTMMDIGCGSGIFSLAALRLKIKKLISFDIDPFSVQCCQYLKNKANNPNHWDVRSGSVLDKAFLDTFPEVDLVYSWGVLHHTGKMYTAIKNAATKVKPGGYFYIAIYNKVRGPLGSKTWLLIKRFYNASPRPVQWIFEIGYALADIFHTIFIGKNPIRKIKNYESHRGMSWYTDIRDWLGGYPYEYATAEEIVSFCENQLGLILLKVERRETLACNEFLFKKTEHTLPVAPVVSQHQPRILFIHSEVRSYRVPIFDMIRKYYPTKFIFTHGTGFAKEFSETKDWQYQYLKSQAMLFYSSDFSFGLIGKLFQKRRDYDLLISSELASFATHIAFLLAKILRKKFIVWSEDWVWPKIFSFQLALPYVKYIVRHADACIVSGKKAREFFLSLGVPREKIYIAPNCAMTLKNKPLDHKSFEEFRVRVNPHNKKVISYLGRVVRYKALDTLIHAFAELERKRDDVRLVIAGDGPFAPECHSLIQELKIKNFYWAQHHNLGKTREVEPIPYEELFYYYRLSDIFVLPGRYLPQENVPSESWGFTLNEALSLGIPCISTDSVAAAHDLIQNGENGYRVKAGDVQALTEALEKILNSPLLLESNIQKRQEKFEFSSHYRKMFSGFQDAITSLSL